ncbi:MAG: hypothetical protein ABJA35_14720 [Parafilimonas sp.]
MPRNKKRIFFELPFIIIAAVFLFGFIVMLLWNFIFPPVLNTGKISYWQAVALLVLCRILFFGFRRRNHSPGMWRGRGTEWRQKWMNMSDEERMKFREGWKKRCRRPEEE